MGFIGEYGSFARFLKMNRDEELIKYLQGFKIEEKNNKFLEILKNRTRHITVGIENVYQSHNSSAVLRTCDCFGIQDVHIMENGNEFSVNDDVALGSAQWLSVHRYNNSTFNTPDCYQNLKDQGYKIVATTPHKNGISLEDYPVEQKTALIFGTERRGLSDYAINNADAWLNIPMYGFAESFNISVSVAICLQHFRYRMKQENKNFQLSAEDHNQVLINWLRNTIREGNKIADRFLDGFDSKKN